MSAHASPACRHHRPRLLRRAVGKLRAFARADDGVAAVETCLIMSLFFIPAWLAFAEVAKLQERTTMLNTTTAMVADMIARFPEADQAKLDAVMTTASFVVGENRNGANDLTMMVMGVVVPAELKPGETRSTTPWVAWSMSNKTGLKTCTLKEPLPRRVARPTATERFLIVADGNLIYNSPLRYLREGAENLDHRSIYAPRETATRNGPNPCPAPS